jgi:hypothetical protein
MLHFKPGTLIRWSTKNSQISLTQSQKRESTDIHQFQGLIILADERQPKLTIGTIVILEVFDGPFGRIKVYIKLVIENLARILDIQAKVRDVVIPCIFSILYYIGPLDWTLNGYPSR